MSKRPSLRRLIKERKVENERMIKDSYGYENMADVCGGPTHGEDEYRKRLQVEIEQCEYLLKQYDEKYPKDTQESET